MKKRLLICLLLALVLTTLLPVSALAAPPVPFAAQGVITGISTSNEFPAGKSGRVVVTERTIAGTLIDGSLTGDFSLTYRANVDLATQAGNFHGTINVGENVLKASGKINAWTLVPVSVPGLPPYLPMLTFDGRWTSIDGAHGQGEFSGYFVFVPINGHVAFIVDGGFGMTGKWQP